MLIFGKYQGVRRQRISLFDPVHRDFSKTVGRCRSFPYDLEVFRRVEPEHRYLPHLASKEKISIDVGANIGFYSALLSPLSASVYAWEANALLIPYLTINMHRYTNVRIIPFAASDEHGEAVFNVPKELNGNILAHSGSGSMMNGFMGKMGIEHTPMKVSMQPVDAFHFDNVGFMKIDVEGSEYQVLVGAEQTIQRCRPRIIVENEYRHNSECQKVFDFMQTHDYQGYFYDRAAEMLRSFDEFSLEKHQKSLLDAQHNIAAPKNYVYNFIFAPRENDPLATMLGK